MSQPVFKDPIVERVKRAAVIDVGSNSVRMVVFDGAARSPAYFYNEKVMCGLGASLASTGCLDLQGRERAFAAISRFVAIAEMMNVSDLVGIGTAAIREAEDGRHFCQRVQASTGLRIHIASGEEEARLAAKGVLLGWPDAKGLVSDMGGASMELAEVEDQKVSKCLSSQLGPLVLEKMNLNTDQLDQFVHTTVSGLYDKFRKQNQTLYLVGGSWRALARLNIQRTNYPLRVLNEYNMPPQEIRDTLDWFGTQNIKDVNAMSQVSLDRLRHVEVSGLVLRSLMRVFKPREIAISTNGLREGLLYERMPRKLRQSDPLIEACLHSEHNSARLPGYGNYLYNFIAPLFRKVPDKQKRLIRAVCLLHDVNWRAHPDYRAQICFESATRGNLGGLDHAGRVFIALSLYNRYKNFNDAEPFRKFLALLNEDDIRLAEAVGKAIRFGAMLIVVSPDSLARLKFKPKKNYLVLQLPESYTPIVGEVARTRFKSLAKILGCEAVIQIL